jgi:hypothetical protein
MSYDENEIQTYHYGSPFWAGDQDPILHYGLNEDLFWNFVLLRSKGFAKHLDSPDNRATAVAVYIQRFGTPVIASELSELILKLISISYSGFTDPNAKPAEPVDTRPRDRSGRLMSPKAIKWQEFEKWVNDPQTSSRQVDVRRNSDPEFREFYSTMLRREISSTPVGDAVENLNTPQAPTKKKIAGVDEEELRLWCQQYRTLPMTEVRKILSPAQSGQVVAEHNKKLLEAGIAAGLIA